MEKFNQINIDNDNQLDNFINEYSKMIKEHQKYLNNEIKKIIYQKIDETEKNQSIKLGEIEKNQIERLINKYLGLELEYTGINTINTLSEELFEKYTLISDKLSNETEDKSKLFNEYKEEIKKTLKINQMNWLDKVTGKFIDIFINEISTVLKRNSNIPDEKFDVLVNNLKKSLSNFFSQYEKKFNNDYHNILKNFITQKLIQMKDLLNNTKKINQYSHIINLSNYELIEENNIFYVKDKSTSKKIELVLEDNSLKSKDNKIKFIIDEKHQGYINNETNIRIVIHNGIIKNNESTTNETLITLLLPSQEIDVTREKQLISFSKNDNNYKFFYNYKQTNNVKVIKHMIEKIKQKATGIYNLLIKDPDFNQVLESINNYNNQQEKNHKK